MCCDFRKFWPQNSGNLGGLPFLGFLGPLGLRERRTEGSRTRSAEQSEGILDAEYGDHDAQRKPGKPFLLAGIFRKRAARISGSHMCVLFPYPG